MKKTEQSCTIVTKTSIYVFSPKINSHEAVLGMYKHKTLYPGGVRTHGGCKREVL
jgi:hypothetical protein